ncbi:MAG TPA: carboxypeptidase-like regulatory domain-containing protein [Terracidiphilus sp.]|jgi:hypothetical protein
MYRIGRLFAAVVLAVLGLSLATRAQIVGGTISGTVHDPNGAAVSGAGVTVRQVETGATRSVTTDGEGRFYAPSVPVGAYAVTVNMQGFERQEQAGITLTIGQSLQLAFVLGVERVQQSVEVDANASTVNTSTQSISGVVDERQVKELPLNGRSYDGLLTLNPGTINYTSQRSGGQGTSNSSVGNMFSVSGRRPQDNLFLLNGIEYTGASLTNVTPGGTSGQLLGVDAVREFNVMTDTYGANYGKRAGGQVSIVTTSGTNLVHGTVFEFIRNSALDARNYFDQASIAPFQRNQFGGSLGGPLVKNKLMLFGNYEGFRQAWGLSDVTLVPDDQARLGYLPDSTGTEQYVGVDPSVAPLLALWPAENGPELLTNGKPSGVAETFSNPKQHIREDFGTTRLDYNISQKDLLFGVYTIDDSTADSPSQNPFSRVDESMRAQVASVQEQHVFTQALLNTARFGFSRANFYFDGYPTVDAPGWVSGKLIGAVVIGGSTASNGASTITQAGSNVGSNNSDARNLFTFDDHVYWSHGRHQVEAGGWVQRIQSNSLLAQYQKGQASFADLPSFLKGKVKTFTVVPQSNEMAWRMVEAAAFVDDTIKVTPRLELRAGFRFESTNGWNEAHGRASNYASVNGVIQTDPFVGSTPLKENNAKFLPEPRAGFAWDVWGNGKTAIRGGAGFYRSLLDTLDYRTDQTEPYNTAYALKSAKVSCLSITPGEPLPACGTAAVSPSNVDPNIKTPTVIEWSLRVEQQLALHTALTVGYIGSHSYHQMLTEDANEPVPTFQSDGSAFYPSGSVNANPDLANTTTWVATGIGAYHALTVDLKRQFAQGLQFRANYTYAKNLDNGTAWNTSVSVNTPAFVMFPLEPKLDWGPSATDIRQMFALNGTWQLPFGEKHRFMANAPKAAEAVFGGWAVSGILNVMTGFPFTPQLGYNPTGNGDTRNPVRPNWNLDFHGKLYPHTTGMWFDPTAFAPPDTGTYGNVSRDSLVGPGSSELDVSASKTAHLTERLGLQFRAEFFNVLNHTNFTTPNPVVYSAVPADAQYTLDVAPTAGVITGTSSTSRQIQFGAKLQF